MSRLVERQLLRRETQLTELPERWHPPQSPLTFPISSHAYIELFALFKDQPLNVHSPVYEPPIIALLEQLATHTGSTPMPEEVSVVHSRPVDLGFTQRPTSLALEQMASTLGLQPLPLAAVHGYLTYCQKQLQASQEYIRSSYLFSPLGAQTIFHLSQNEQREPSLVFFHTTARWSWPLQANVLFCLSTRGELTPKRLVPRMPTLPSQPRGASKSRSKKPKPKPAPEGQLAFSFRSAKRRGSGR